MRTAIAIVISIIGGFLLACVISDAIGYALEAPEIRDYRPGQPVFNRPVTDSYAQVVMRQLNAKMDRDGARTRFYQAYPVSGPLFVNAMRVVDPIFDAIFVLAAGIIFWPIKRAVGSFPVAGRAASIDRIKSDLDE